MKLPALSVTTHTQLLVDLQSYATTVCNPDIGDVLTEADFNKFLSYGPTECLDAHENVHANDMRPCCKNVTACINKSTTAKQRNACTQAFNQWQRDIQAYTECNAYRAEITCLTRLVGNPAYNQTDVQARLKEAHDFANHYCRLSNGPVACPYDASGDCVGSGCVVM